LSDGANGRALVAYASWAGSTAEVSEAVAGRLRERGFEVDVERAADVGSLDGYSAVLLGTAVRAGRLHRDAPRFVERHRAALTGRPVAYFLVCMTMREDTEENRRTARAFLDPLFEKAPDVRPVGVGLFGGVIPSGDELRKRPLRQRVLFKVVEKLAGDFRDWDAISAWVGETADKLA